MKNRTENRRRKKRAARKSGRGSTMCFGFIEERGMETDREDGGVFVRACDRMSLKINIDKMKCSSSRRIRKRI